VEFILALVLSKVVVLRGIHDVCHPPDPVFPFSLQQDSPRFAIEQSMLATNQNGSDHSDKQKQGKKLTAYD
jgi:hypothetical protein